MRGRNRAKYTQGGMPGGVGATSPSHPGQIESRGPYLHHVLRSARNGARNLVYLQHLRHSSCEKIAISNSGPHTRTPSGGLALCYYCCTAARATAYS